MGHFALVDENGIVQTVIVADQEHIDSGIHGDASQWIQTSYNTFGGIHYSPQTGQPDGGIALRCNYAQIGGHYDSEADVFYEKQTYPNWILNTTTYQWEPPFPHPSVPPGAPNHWIWGPIRNEWIWFEPTESTE